MQQQQFLPHKLLGPPSLQFSSPQWNQHSQHPRYCSGVLWPLLCKWESPRSIVEPLGLGAGKGPSSSRLLVRFVGATLQSHSYPTPKPQSKLHSPGWDPWCLQRTPVLLYHSRSFLGHRICLVFLFVVLQMKFRAVQMLSPSYILGPSLF